MALDNKRYFAFHVFPMHAFGDILSHLTDFSSSFSGHVCVCIALQRHKQCKLAMQRLSPPVFVSAVSCLLVHKCSVLQHFLLHFRVNFGHPVFGHRWHLVLISGENLLLIDDSVPHLGPVHLVPFFFGQNYLFALLRGCFRKSIAPKLEALAYVRRREGRPCLLANFSNKTPYAHSPFPMCEVPRKYKYNMRTGR